jgi:hypothetical protein
MNRQTLLLSFALLAATLCASSAHAQRNAGAGFIPAGRPAGHPSGQMNGAPHRGALSGRLVRARRGQRTFANSAYGPNFYPYYDSGFGDSYGDYYYDGAASQFSGQTSAPAAPPAQLAYPASPVESLVVELRGDHWVRLTSYGAQEPGANGNANSNQEIASFPNRSTATTAAARTSPPVELPPALLVFRDGHTEQAANYTIIGKALTIKTDYWTTGAWTRTIPLATLDLPATLKLNRERGTRFSLPTRTGEVMMRP